MNRFVFSKKLFAVVFIIIISSPVLFEIIIEPDISIENRAITEKPVWEDLSTLQKYEDYFVDRIAFRKQFIEISSLIDFYLFKKPITDKVLIGKNNQLFYIDGHIGEDIKRELVVTEEQITAIINVQNEIQSEMNERGIKYLIVLAPDKHNIYTEDMPDYYLKYYDYPSCKDTIVDALRNNTNVDILDLTNPIKEETKIRDTFLSTDSHWNYDGSFVGYTEIIKHLNKTFNNLPMFHRSDFKITDWKVNNQNLAKLLSLGEILYDKSAVKYNPDKPGTVVDVEPSYPDPNWFSSEFHMIVTEQKNNINLPRAIMYRDSFAGLDDWAIGNLNRFLNNSFSRFASYATHQIDFNYIDTENADVVIFELLDSNILRLGINFLDNGELQKDKPLYAFDTPLNGEYYKGD